MILFDIRMIIVTIHASVLNISVVLWGRYGECHAMMQHYSQEERMSAGQNLRSSNVMGAIISKCMLDT